MSTGGSFILPDMQNTVLKVAMVVSEMMQQQLALRANELLPPEEQITELHVTRWVTRRRDPTPAQRAVVARILNQPAHKLFPR